MVPVLRKLSIGTKVHSTKELKPFFRFGLDHGYLLLS